jgi:hypothetical protein
MSKDPNLHTLFGLNYGLLYKISCFKLDSVQFMLAAMYPFVFYPSKINLTGECQELMLAMLLGFSAVEELLLRYVLDQILDAFRPKKVQKVQFGLSMCFF